MNFTFIIGLNIKKSNFSDFDLPIMFDDVVFEMIFDLENILAKKAGPS
jgi:hypothetical protein